jgi:hypothetical protein
MCMSVRGLHQILDDAPDATRTYRVCMYERHNPDAKEYIIIPASLDSLIEKTQEMLEKGPEYRSLVFEFPGTTHSIISYKMPSGDIGCFKGREIR